MREYQQQVRSFSDHQKALELGRLFSNKGDVLIDRMPDPLGRVCLFPGDRKKSVKVVDVAIVRSGKGEFNHRWLMSLINAPAFAPPWPRFRAGNTRKPASISSTNLARYSVVVRREAAVRSSPRSKSSSPASTKPSPTSSASRPTSNATKPPSSKPPSKGS